MVDQNLISKADAYKAAVMARDNGMLMIAAMVMAIAILMILYHRPKSKSQEPCYTLANWWCYGLVIIGIVLRHAVWLVPDNLWYDEAFTAAVVSASPANALIAILHDVHPPGWYMITKLFITILGQSELALRYPAMLASIASLILFKIWLDRSPTNNPVKITALMIMVLSPAGLRFAAEARCYAGLELAALAILAGALLNQPLLYIAGMIAAPWLHHVGWVYSLVGASIYYYRYHKINDLVLSLFLTMPAGVFALYQIVGPGLGSGLAKSGYWIHDKNIGAFLYHAVFQQFFSPSTTPEMMDWFTGFFALAFWAVAIFGAIKSKRWELALMAFGPSLVILTISQWRPMLLGRTLLGTAPSIYLLAAIGLDRLRSRIAPSIIYLMAVLMIIGGVNQLLGAARGTITPIFDAARAAGCTEIIHSEPSSAVMALYYAPAIQNYLWSGFDPGLQTGALTLETEHALGIERKQLENGKCILYADHAMVPPENIDILDREIAKDSRTKIYVLTDDQFSYIALFK